MLANGKIPGEVSLPGAQTKQTAAAPTVVLVWDLDETLVVFNSLLNGTWAAANVGCDAGACTALGHRVASTIFKFLDEHFMYQQAIYDCSLGAGFHL
jgi:hypothetical protein